MEKQYIGRRIPVDAAPNGQAPASMVEMATTNRRIRGGAGAGLCRRDAVSETPRRRPCENPRLRAEAIR